MLMSYDNPLRQFYFQPSSAFGAATESTQWRGPKDKTGLVRDIEVYITATMVGTTSVPEITVGTASALFEYARFRLGTTAIAGYAATAPFRASIIADDAWGVSVYEDFVGHVKMATLRIPANAIFFISRVLGVGGAPAGTGSSIVTIDWF